ncbi:MAG: DUF429 domain-containing protein [Shimia thalassica]|uniref:DUF429 domain-containing protein n=1 Tax=Shimia thalassica TaxID=1715693 RepID=A0A0P1I3U2_9RHOB|nr:DUF429 domain-containing protein [Shimia thalassica]CUJ88703.1 hypothetical protein PH7735_00965 [Shimia thalassica]
MALFLGYDPGGKAKNGVAAISLESDVPEVVATATVRDASEALLWLAAYSGNAQAVGIDTLLAWSPKGGRACDDALRRRYGGNSVVAQNSLYSAMTLNGAIVARRLGLPVYESHPKLLLQLEAGDAIRTLYRETFAKAGTDHAADAIVAAWCAAMGHTRKWAVELYSDIDDDIELVVPGARYPWFETIG